MGLNFRDEKPADNGKQGTNKDAQAAFQEFLNKITGGQAESLEDIAKDAEEAANKMRPGATERINDTQKKLDDLIDTFKVVLAKQDGMPLGVKMLMLSTKIKETFDQMTEEQKLAAFGGLVSTMAIMELKWENAFGDGEK